MLALGLAAVVFAGVRGPGALDDADRAAQRPGLLIAGGEARDVGGLALPGGRLGRVPVVVIFDRRVPQRRAFERLLRDVPLRAAVVVVVPATTPARREVAGIAVVADPRGDIARTIGMPQPKGGGRPVGYALIDSRARVRYATLGPTYLEHGFEIDAVVGALR